MLSYQENIEKVRRESSRFRAVSIIEWFRDGRMNALYNLHFVNAQERYAQEEADEGREWQRMMAGDNAKV